MVGAHWTHLVNANNFWRGGRERADMISARVFVRVQNNKNKNTRLAGTYVGALKYNYPCFIQCNLSFVGANSALGTLGRNKESFAVSIKYLLLLALMPDRKLYLLQNCFNKCEGLPRHLQKFKPRDSVTWYKAAWSDINQGGCFYVLHTWRVIMVGYGQQIIRALILLYLTVTSKVA